MPSLPDIRIDGAYVERLILDLGAIGALAVDALNRPYLRPGNDVADPAFRTRQLALLIVGITIP